MRDDRKTRKAKMNPLGPILHPVGCCYRHVIHWAKNSGKHTRFTPRSYVSAVVTSVILIILLITSLVFTARCYASAVLAMGLCPSLRLCPSVSVSVTSRCSTKTAKRGITKTTPHDSPGTLVFGCQRSLRNSSGVTPYMGAPNAGGVGQNRRLSTNNRLYLENGTR